MAFEVSDLPGQPLLCCNRTLADHCVAFVPLVDRLFTSCTVVQEVDPFAAFRKNTAAPLIFLLQNPGWVLWVGLCITWRVLGVGADAAAGREWKWQSFLRPTLFVEAQLQARAPLPSCARRALSCSDPRARCPDAAAAVARRVPAGGAADSGLLHAAVHGACRDEESDEPDAAQRGHHARGRAGNTPEREPGGDGGARACRVSAAAETQREGAGEERGEDAGEGGCEGWRDLGQEGPRAGPVT